MLTSFSIGNFKAFGPTQTIPIKPITLVYGQNSAGKSSIMDAILFASHLARNGVPGGYLNVPFYQHYFDFEITGSRVRLGMHEDFLHGKSDIGEEITLGASIGEGASVRRIDVRIDGDGVYEYALKLANNELFYALGPKESYGGDIFRPYSSRELALNTEHQAVKRAIGHAARRLRNSVMQLCKEKPKTKAARFLKEWILEGRFPSEENKTFLINILKQRFSKPRASLSEFPPGLNGSFFEAVSTKMAPCISKGLQGRKYRP